MQCETAPPALAPLISSEAFCPGEGMVSQWSSPNSRQGTRKNPWLRLDRARKIIRAVLGAEFWWQKSPKGCDRHEELKRRLHRWDAGEVQGSHLKNSWTTAHWAASRKKRRKMKPQTEEQQGTRACAFTARGSLGQTHCD